jgi:hypothetical protein
MILYHWTKELLFQPHWNLYLTVTASWLRNALTTATTVASSTTGTTFGPCASLVQSHYDIIVYSSKYAIQVMMLELELYHQAIRHLESVAACCWQYELVRTQVDSAIAWLGGARSRTHSAHQSTSTARPVCKLQSQGLLCSASWYSLLLSRSPESWTHSCNTLN